MFRFHGMPFVDLAHLRKSDLKDGYLTLRRRKTGMPLSARVDGRAMQLLERYRNRDDTSPYLLCFLDGNLRVWPLTGITNGYCACLTADCVRLPCGRRYKAK